MATKKELKLPPQDLDAERSVLGALMLDKNAIVKVTDILQASDFYHPTHQHVYDAITDLFAHGEPIDILTVSNKLKTKKRLKEVGGADYLTELVSNVPTSAHIEHYANIVREKRVRRDLIGASSEISEEAFDRHDFEELLDRIEQKIFGISQRSRTQRFTPVKDELPAAYERLEKLHRGDKNMLRGIPTHFTQLDYLLSGLQKSDLILLGARPSFGKTALALDIAREAALSGHTVGIFSLEMSREQVTDRIIAAQAQIPLWRLRTGRLNDDLEFALVQQALDELSKAKLFIDDTPSPTTFQMRSMARRLQIEHGLELLIIDYLQLIQPRTSSDNIVQQVTEISRNLKTLARELSVPVLALSQLSRDVDRREVKIPRLSDLRESGCLSGDTLITRADTGERIPLCNLAKRPRQTPVQVFAIDDDYKIRPHTMIKVFSSGIKEVFELRTASGRTIKASSNHPFLAVGGWKRLEHLTVGDRIGLPRELPVLQPRPLLSEQEIILLAHLLGDGCILPKQPYHYTSANPENIAYVRTAAAQIFGVRARLVRQKNWFHLYLPSPYRLTHNRYHPITDWFKRLGIARSRSYEKRIPEAVFSSHERLRALFLRHLWSTDGNISWKKLRKRRPAGNIYYATSSPILAEQVQHLLLTLGIPSTLARVPSRRGYRPMYHLLIQGSPAQSQFLKTVGVNDTKKMLARELLTTLVATVPNPNADTIPREVWKILIEPAKETSGISWRDFSSMINTAYCGSTLFQAGLSRERMSRVATMLRSRLVLCGVAGQEIADTLANVAASDVYWDKIIAISPGGIEEVFDATVERAHNFVANDFIVHNSLEQDADVVLFIHRKDRERLDLPEEEQNLVDIIIAKHRNGPLGTAQLRFDPEKVTFRNIDKYHEEPQGE